MDYIGFDSRWTRLILMCVNSIQYAVLVNETPYGHITPSRGKRQGDPISPYLFLLCAEALSSMISHATIISELTGVPTSKRSPSISHLFFADNSMLFCKTSISQWVQMAKILHMYEKASGQKMNSSKTSIFLAETLHLWRRIILWPWREYQPHNGMTRTWGYWP
jgi:hypothetical protein